MANALAKNHFQIAKMPGCTLRKCLPALRSDHNIDKRNKHGNWLSLCSVPQRRRMK